MKPLSKNQFLFFFRVFSFKEKLLFFFFFILFLGSSFFLLNNFYLRNTQIEASEGGLYIEGLLGSPRFINPIFAISDVDRDLVEIIYSGLMKYGPGGRIIPDLAKDYKILEEGRVFEFHLREDLFWQDGEKITSDDVVFTIKTLQNSDIKSDFRGLWLGVEVEKISPSVVRFKLKNPSAIFLEHATFKIIPQHIWKEVSVENFSLSPYNLKPVGSGPFTLKEIIQDENGKIISLNLVKNHLYHGKKPYLNQISFRFFEKEEDLLKSYLNKEIFGFSLKEFSDSPPHPSLNSYLFPLSWYFSIFLNPEKVKAFSEKEVREALNLGINKDEIVERVLKNKAKTVNSAILAEIFPFSHPAKIYPFDPEKAKNLLEKKGFQESEDGIRKKVIKKEAAFQFKNNLSLGAKGKEVEELQKCLAKDPSLYPEGEITGYFGQKTKEAVIRFQEKYRTEILEPERLKKGNGIVKERTQKKLNELCFPPKEETVPLEFKLIIPDHPLLWEVAKMISLQWQNLGIKMEIEKVNLLSPENEIVKTRNYEAILIGEVLGLTVDPFPFWHSSQKKDPGLNLAFLENKEIDNLLEEARQTIDWEKRKEKLEKFQNLLNEEAPAILLYTPCYQYFVAKEIKGISEELIVEPSKRFNQIENWYFKTKRVWKKNRE